MFCLISPVEQSPAWSVEGQFQMFSGLKPWFIPNWGYPCKTVPCINNLGFEQDEDNVSFY